jgi:hypothetical protein
MPENTTSPEVTATPAEFPQARHDALLQTAQSLAIVYNLLNQGLYQGSARNDLNKVIPFVEEMHKGVLAELEPLMEQAEAIAVAAEEAAKQATEPDVEA